MTEGVFKHLCLVLIAMKHEHALCNEESVLTLEEQTELEKLCIPALDYSD